MVKGTVGNENAITWVTKDLPDFDNVNKEIKNKLKQNTVGSSKIDGFAFLIKNNKIVFVVKGDVEEEGNKKVAAVFLLEETAKNKLKLVEHDESTTGNYPIFFQWEGKIFKISTDDSTESSQNNVKEFQAGKEPRFEKNYNPIARLRDFLKDKHNFITAAVPEKGNVLLFTEQKEVKGDGISNSNGNKNVYLWMTDGTRVSCAGTIFPNGFTGTFYVSLLYTDNKLFALQLTSETLDAKKKIDFVLLEKQLDNITKTLDAWKKNDENIKNLYEDAASATTDINFTNGIVGLLSGNEKRIDHWKDEYYNVNATVTQTADKVQNGFRFSGAGAGAVWQKKKKKKTSRTI